MTISIRRISLGSGYKYLIESVARGDGAVSQSSPLTRYYAESGTPPGRFMGAGLAGLNDGNGVGKGSEVTEQMLFNMLGMCSDPVTGQQLGRAANRWPKPLQTPVSERVAALAPNLNAVERADKTAEIEAEERQRERTITRPVAGFDLTFSVPKSISVAWAVADAGTQSVIYAAHQEAIQHTLAYAERHTFFTRTGTNGVVQEQVRGVVATAFDHWDSRAGDPQLHTHLVMFNRVQSLDGVWRTLDSRGLFKQVVTLSEMHEGILSDLLTDRLGWGFDPRPRKHSAEPKHEVTGVSDELQREFSQRSTQIEHEKNRQVQAFIAKHGRRPSPLEAVRLRQHATLATRPPKQHRSLGEQTEQWRRRARHYVGKDTVTWAQTLRDRNDLPRLRADDLDDEMLADTAREGRRTARHVHPRERPGEVHRLLHGVRFAAPDDRIAVAERATDTALADAVALSPRSPHHVPQRFQRADGSSKFRPIGAEVYTTEALLDAETRLLDAGRDVTGPVVDRSVIAAVCEQELPGKTYPMSTDQALAVEQIASSGRVVDVLVGPAGTGKSTSMAGLRAVWEAQHGPGSVLGLAPSAVASEVLADELGIETDNTAKWLTEQKRQPERRHRLRRLQPLAHRAGLAPAQRSRLAARIAELESEIDRWDMTPGRLVIIDEASLAGTFALDTLAVQARSSGAKLLLVGDWAQLSAIEAGGAFAMLVRDRAIAPELRDVHRFSHGWEKTASIALRVGNEDAIGDYTRHGRVVSGARDELLDALYSAWQADVARGQTSLMIAGDLDTVAELNRRAQADRAAVGEVHGGGLPIAGGGQAYVGDRVVTRLNDRHLTTGRHRWVKNGDAWIVTGAAADGWLTVRRETGGGEVVLPAAYAREHIELGYASTAHRAQGRTVDTAHALLSVTTTREVLYVSATRGRQSNRLYVDTYYEPDHDTSHGPVEPMTQEAVLKSVLDNVGADQSAHTQRERDHDSANSIATLAAEYLTIARVAQAERWDGLIDSSGLDTAQVEQVRASDAYGPLLAAFRDAEARALDITAAFPVLVQGRELRTAEDVASVLHGRVGRWIRAAASGRRPGAARFVAGVIPEALNVTDPDMARALAGRAEAMQRRAREIAERDIARHAAWTRPLGPPPSDPARREAWLREMVTIAAFRDRWNVTSRRPVPADRSSLERAGHEKRAEQADARAARIASGLARPQLPSTGGVHEIETGLPEPTM